MSAEPVTTTEDRSTLPVLWVVVIGVVGLAITSVLTFGWGVAKTWDFARTLFDEGADSEEAIILVLEIIDTFLLATVVAILAIGLFELFIRDLPGPAWLVINDLGDLKAKVSDVIVLLLAIKFLEKIITIEEPLDLVWYALSVTLVGALLIAFRVIRPKH
ncbi:MAG: YqhA family protein [Ilumatobacteraceae bacterium]